MENQPEQRSPEWFEQRKGRITASLVGAILGCAPYLTREAAMRRMVRDYHDAPSEFEGNVATDHGVINEQVAIADYMLESGNAVQTCGFFAKDVDGLPIGASPDGLIGNSKVLEVKVPYAKRKDAEPDFKSIALLPHYYHQVQMQMFCTSAVEADFFQWSANGCNLEAVAYDPQWWINTKPMLEVFYAEYLAAIKDPQEHLEPLRAIIDTPDAVLMMREYDDCLEQIERATQRKAEILEALIAKTNGKNAIIAGRKLTSVQKAGAVSYARVVKDWAASVDLEPYRGKPSSYWKLG